MSEIPRLAGGQPRQTTDYELCLVCQKQAGPLVLNPRLPSYHNLLEKVKERARLHDPECVPLQKRLEDCTQETLQRDKAVWHRGCYSKITNAVQMERAVIDSSPPCPPGHTLQSSEVAGQEALMT